MDSFHNLINGHKRSWGKLVPNSDEAFPFATVWQTYLVMKDSMIAPTVPCDSRMPGFKATSFYFEYYAEVKTRKILFFPRSQQLTPTVRWISSSLSLISWQPRVVGRLFAALAAETLVLCVETGLVNHPDFVNHPDLVRICKSPRFHHSDGKAIVDVVLHKPSTCCLGQCSAAYLHTHTRTYLSKSPPTPGPCGMIPDAFENLVFPHFLFKVSSRKLLCFHINTYTHAYMYTHMRSMLFPILYVCM
jgi:hypothetical protein